MFTCNISEESEEKERFNRISIMCNSNINNYYN